MYSKIFGALLFSLLMLVCAERATHSWTEVRAAYAPV